MASRFTKLALAALLAAPALAAPAPRPAMVTVYQTVTQTAGSGSQVKAQGVAPAAQAQQTNPPAGTAVQAAHSSTTSTSSTSSSGSGNGSGGNSPGGSTGGSNSGKMGLAYIKDPVAASLASQIAASASGQIKWVYDWEGYPDNGATTFGGGVEFVPMLHEPTGDFSSDWATPTLMPPQAASATHALFINEPDMASTTVKPTDAAAAYKSLYEPNVKGSNAQLGSAGTTNGGASSAQWNKEFFDSCASKDCQIDFLALHYYSPAGMSVADSVNDFICFIQASQTDSNYQYNGKALPVWVTEFSLTAVNMGGTQEAADRADFIAQAANWMDQPEQDYIQRYSPYMVYNSDAKDAIKPGNDIAKAYINHASATAYQSSKPSCTANSYRLA